MVGERVQGGGLIRPTPIIVQSPKSSNSNCQLIVTHSWEEMGRVSIESLVILTTTVLFTWLYYHVLLYIVELALGCLHTYISCSM